MIKNVAMYVTMNIYYMLGVYSFTLGCLSFTFDAIKSHPIRKSYLLGCILFDLGCGFFILDSHNANNFI